MKRKGSRAIRRGSMIILGDSPGAKGSKGSGVGDVSIAFFVILSDGGGARVFLHFAKGETK